MRVASAVFADATEQNLAIDGIRLSGRRITVFLAGGPYRQSPRNIGRAARIAANNAPPNVEEIEVASSSAGMEVNRIVFRRKDLERAAAGIGLGSMEELWANADVLGPGRRSPETIENPDAFPRFGFGLLPSIRQHIGSGDQFYLYQLFLRLGASAQLSRGLTIDGAVGIDLYNNFSRLTSPPDSNLPNVRSDIKRYLQQGANNLIRLQTNYVWSPAPDFYARITAGFLEEMYGGYSGEMLYRPFGGRFAAGVDLNYVRQRNFDQRFSFLDYTVLTGHLNLYYDLPWYDILGQLHVGQYLAGDKGATFQLSRRFDSGVRVGAFFTLTDVPFSVFGEGSFDKGFFVTLPLDLFSTRSSTSAGLFGFRPLTRDGGQRVSVRPRLYDVTAGGNLGEIDRDWDRVLD
ncbi:MAG: YjbH domain-containing protein [Alphaproteobacteria bacterium]|nr:YjbH domain-containing protein [Alphaproteobacteria bacterium]